jgi:hypothetical protein
MKFEEFLKLYKKIIVVDSYGDASITIIIVADSFVDASIIIIIVADSFITK